MSAHRGRHKSGCRIWGVATPVSAFLIVPPYQSIPNRVLEVLASNRYRHDPITEDAMATDRPGAVWTQHKPTIAVPRSLWAAAKADDVVQLAHLLDEGCPIDERDYRGYSALMLAG